MPYGKEEFRQDVFLNMKKYPSWRYGQAVFNTMFNEIPDAADKFRGTEHDPFYHDEKADTFIDLCFDLYLNLMKEGEL